MPNSSQTLSSIDSIGSGEAFQSIYSLLNRLKEDTTTIRDGLKACNKRIVEIPFSERLLEPKPHAVAWFKKRQMETPCDLEDFLEKLFGELAVKRHICHKTRTLFLDKDEAKLFDVEPNTIYKWVEILERLPNVFY